MVERTHIRFIAIINRESFGKIFMISYYATRSLDSRQCLKSDDLLLLYTITIKDNYCSDNKFGIYRVIVTVDPL